MSRSHQAAPRNAPFERTPEGSRPAIKIYDDRADRAGGLCYAVRLRAHRRILCCSFGESPIDALARGAAAVLTCVVLVQPGGVQRGRSTGGNERQPDRERRPPGQRRQRHAQRRGGAKPMPLPAAAWGVGVGGSAPGGSAGVARWWCCASRQRRASPPQAAPFTCAITASTATTPIQVTPR